MQGWLKDLTAMTLIGDGVVGLVTPRTHCKRWEVGPRKLRRFVHGWAKRPTLTRVFSAAGIGMGVWLMLRGR